MREAKEDGKEVLTLFLPVPGDRELGHCYELNLGMHSCSKQMMSRVDSGVSWAWATSRAAHSFT